MNLSASVSELVVLSIPAAEADNPVVEDLSQAKRFRCEFCPYNSPFKCNLDKHVRRHKGEKPYACSQCNYTAACPSNLSAHFRRRHDKSNATEIVSLPLLASAARPSGEVPSRHIGNLSHRQRFSSPIAPSVEGQSRPVESLENLQPSLNSCTEVLLSIPPVDIQNFEDSSQVKRFQCELCPYTTAFKCNLDKHIRRHRGEKPYGCTICDYATACQSHLAAHVRSCLRRRAISVDVNSTAMGPV